MPRIVPIKWITEHGQKFTWARPRRGPLREGHPLVYAFGFNIKPHQRAVFELALHRWENKVGFVLAEPMRPGDVTFDLLIDTAKIEKVIYDPGAFSETGLGSPADAIHVTPQLPFQELTTHLERFVWKCSDPGAIVEGVLLLEQGRVGSLMEPCLHGLGHALGLDHPDGPHAHLALMHDLLGGHLVPTLAEAEAVRERYAR